MEQMHKKSYFCHLYPEMHICKKSAEVTRHEQQKPEMIFKKWFSDRLVVTYNKCSPLFTTPTHSFNQQHCLYIMDEKESKRTSNLQFVFRSLLFHLRQHHVYWPGNMSCCVKSSVLRRLAEQKGQKSMLIKGCGQLLACGFALIKAKCSCSQETLLIYSSNSAHWLWVRPVGFVALRALTKKSQHFLQRLEVCMCACVCTCTHTCAGCPCGESAPRAVFSRLCQKHVAWSNTPASHGVKSLVLCTSQSLGQSIVNQIYSLSCREQLHNKNNLQ